MSLKLAAPAPSLLDSLLALTRDEPDLTRREKIDRVIAFAGEEWAYSQLLQDLASSAESPDVCPPEDLAAVVALLEGLQERVERA